jgi:FMN reductase [NAD(P)H]
MSAYADVVERRFGDGGPSGEGVVENDFIRRVISRKTVRRYSDAVPSEALLDLLVAAALSTSAKSDFQQASILRVTDPTKRAAIGKLFPSMPWIGLSPVFFVAESRFATERWKVFSTPASMRRWRCRP